MGLDVSTKNKYQRFNWTGVRAFREWSIRELGVNPFPSWDGGNGTIVVFNREPENEREVQGDLNEVSKWIEAFIKWQLEDNEVPQEEEWEYHSALEWFWVLQSALEYGYINYF